MSILILICVYIEGLVVYLLSLKSLHFMEYETLNSNTRVLREIIGT